MRIDQVRRQLAQIQGAGGPTNTQDPEEEEEEEGEEGYEYDEEEDESSSEEELKKEMQQKRRDSSKLPYDLRNSKDSPQKKNKEGMNKNLMTSKADTEEEKSPIKKHILLDKQSS